MIAFSIAQEREPNNELGTDFRTAYAWLTTSANGPELYIKESSEFAGGSMLTGYNLDERCEITCDFSDMPGQQRPSTKVTSAYPIPVRNGETLKIKGVNTAAAFTIISSTGQNAMQGILKPEGIKIPADLPAGTYLLRIEEAGKITKRTIIIK